MRRRNLKKNSLSYVFDALFYIVTLGLIVGALMSSYNQSTDKSVMGIRFLGVLTNSMAPNQQDSHPDGFREGDLIVTQDISGTKAEVGDIITYYPSMESNVFLTHRVVKKLDELNGKKGVYFITKGDNNSTEDLPISKEQVVAKKLFTIPKLGLVIKFIQENLVLSLVGIIAFIGFIWLLKSLIHKKE